MAKCKYIKEQEIVSYNGGIDWQNVMPDEYRKGQLIEYDSDDCGSLQTIYRWRTLEGVYLCDGDMKYEKKILDESYDNGITWYVSFPSTYDKGNQIGVDSDYCNDKFVGHYVLPDPESTQAICGRYYRWNGFECVYVDPLKVVKCDNTGILTTADTAYYTSNGFLTSCEIGKCVTSINSAFYDVYSSNYSVFTSCTFVEDSQLISIGERAFSGCRNLTSIDIPSGVTTIGNYAFNGCTCFTSMIIPNSVATIGDYAFGGCRSLTSCTIGSGVTSIGQYAFSNCTGLTSIDIPSGVTSIGQYAFSNCSGLTTVDIQGGSIGNNVFTGCTSLVGCTMGNGVTSIGSSAFRGCSGLTNVVIPDSVTSISGNAFAYCYGLTSCTIGSGVTSIGSSAFRGCSGLTSCTIGNGVTSIGNDAFRGCDSLTSIDIPSGVTSIDNGAFWCYGVTAFTVNAATPPTLAANAFGGAYGYKIYVPCGSVSLYKAATNWSSYASILHGIPPCEIVYKIISTSNTGDTLFVDCNSSPILTITEVQNVDFGYSYSAVIGNCVTEIASSGFSGCYNLANISIPSGVTTIGEYAFRRCRKLTSMDIPSGVTRIEQGTFQGCTGLTSLDVPNGVTWIGEYAFDYCSGMTSCTIGSGVTHVGGYAFRGCKRLTSIDIPSGVTSIGSQAFFNCSTLTSVTVEATIPPTLGTSTFTSTNNCPILVPSQSVNRYKSASGWSDYASRIQAIT